MNRSSSHSPGPDSRLASSDIYQSIRRAVDAIQVARPQFRPQLGLILGSGLNSVADAFESVSIIPYNEIPGFFGTTVEGNTGEMILGTFAGVACVALKGRFHFYEGYSMTEVVFPTRTISAMGIETLVLTNAAGGINPNLTPGDFMVISDHLNLMGDNPLRGTHLAELGPRFPDMTEAYDAQCLRVLSETAVSLGYRVTTGVYAGMLGPTFETPAEVRMLRTLGADAVGMSTVPECVAAHHLGVRVAGVSCITNLAAGLDQAALAREAVVSNSVIAAQKLRTLLLEAAPRLVTFSAPQAGRSMEPQLPLLF